jgi:hypothetical protein
MNPTYLNLGSIKWRIKYNFVDYFCMSNLLKAIFNYIEVDEYRKAKLFDWYAKTYHQKGELN